MRALLTRYRADMMAGKARGNCLVYALVSKALNGRRVKLRFRRSPAFPLLPRVSYSYTGGKSWMRFQHKKPPRIDGWRKWLPVHAVWFKGTARRDLA